jgi:hypothetical protein
LTTTTGIEVAVSLSAIQRPCRSGICIAAKYPGVACRPPVAVERQIVDHGRGADAGNRGQARGEIRVKLRERGAGLVARSRQFGIDAGDLRGGKAGIDLQHAPEAGHEQRPAGHEDDRGREFPNDQRIAEDAALRGAAPARVAQIALHV